MLCDPAGVINGPLHSLGQEDQMMYNITFLAIDTIGTAVGVT